MNGSLAKSTAVRYPKPGESYRHYKGGEYRVITLAEHSETKEVMVVYQSILFGSFHVRPLSMWFEKVMVIERGLEEETERFVLIH